MGGLLGPANGLYHDLGLALSALGIGSVRVGYRRPNDLEACVLDMGAAADLASQSGARRFVAVGHSFGGAVAVNAGLAMPTAVAGVVTLSTQSAGCQMAAGLAGRPLLLLHGDRDEILPPETSETVKMLAGYGEVVILPGAGHLLTEVADDVRARLLEWIPAVLTAPAPPAPPPPPAG
jgi:pimeloyl-ACP methyl ester carboxylesterase